MRLLLHVLYYFCPIIINYATIAYTILSYIIKVILLLIQYYFGDDILVAPVTETVNNDTQVASKKIWIPKVLQDIVHRRITREKEGSYKLVKMYIAYLLFEL